MCIINRKEQHGAILLQQIWKKRQGNPQGGLCSPGLTQHVWDDALERAQTSVLQVAQAQCLRLTSLGADPSHLPEAGFFMKPQPVGDGPTRCLTASSPSSENEGEMNKNHPQIYSPKWQK